MILAYEKLMKYGVIPEYWNEYVFQAYSNFQSDVIFLHGIPDKPDSLPHFDPESSLSINLSRVKERIAMRKKASKMLKRRLKRR